MNQVVKWWQSLSYWDQKWMIMKKNNKKKGTNKCAIKRKITFDDYRNCLEVTQLENKINWPKNLM